MAWKIVGMAVMAAALLGCSIHNQSAIKRVAYDFSDYAYYDRGYAPSPSYAALPAYYEAGLDPASDEADEPSDTDADEVAEGNIQQDGIAAGADANRPSPARTAPPARTRVGGEVEGRIADVEGTQAQRPVTRSESGGTIAHR